MKPSLEDIETARRNHIRFEDGTHSVYHMNYAVDTGV
jgi:hypothetical protein